MTVATREINSHESSVGIITADQITCFIFIASLIMNFTESIKRVSTRFQAHINYVTYLDFIIPTSESYQLVTYEILDLGLASVSHHYRYRFSNYYFSLLEK